MKIIIVAAVIPALIYCGIGVLRAWAMSSSWGDEPASFFDYVRSAFLWPF